MPHALLPLPQQMEARSVDEYVGSCPGLQHRPLPRLAMGKHWPSPGSQQVAVPQGASSPVLEQHLPAGAHWLGLQGCLLGPHGRAAPFLRTHSLTPPPRSTHVSSASEQQEVAPHGVAPRPQHLRCVVRPGVHALAWAGAGS